MAGTLEPTKLKICSIWPFMGKLDQLLFYIRFWGLLTFGKRKGRMEGLGYKWGVNDYILFFKLMGYISLLIISILKIFHYLKRAKVFSPPLLLKKIPLNKYFYCSSFTDEEARLGAGTDSKHWKRSKLRTICPGASKPLICAACWACRLAGRRDFLQGCCGVNFYLQGTVVSCNTHYWYFLWVKWVRWTGHHPGCQR